MRESAFASLHRCARATKQFTIPLDAPMTDRCTRELARSKWNGGEEK